VSQRSKELKRVSWSGNVMNGEVESESWSGRKKYGVGHRRKE